MKPYFVNEEAMVLMGEDAEKALTSVNDIEYYSKSEGVVRVPVERWRTAQKCEKKHWMSLGLKYSDDRNGYHLSCFDGYRALKGYCFSSALEIGCGPFTNLRFISTVAKIERCTLLDPLITEYLSHPYCRYNDQYLFPESRSLMVNRIKNRVPVKIKNFLFHTGNKIPVVALLNIPAEKLSVESLYDLVVMINVVEHCYNIHDIFSRILAALKPGGMFVFEDKLYDSDSVCKDLKIGYDAAHPLRVDRRIFEEFIKTHFVLRYKRIQTNFLTLEGQDFTWDDIYCIAEKKKM